MVRLRRPIEQRDRRKAVTRQPSPVGPKAGTMGWRAAPPLRRPALRLAQRHRRQQALAWNQRCLLLAAARQLLGLGPGRLPGWRPWDRPSLAGPVRLPSRQLTHTSVRRQFRTTTVVTESASLRAPFQRLATLAGDVATPATTSSYKRCDP